MRANDRHVDKFCGPVPDSPSLIGMLRPALALGSLVVTAALLTACASEPEPEWTEEEAYAAAEETFRAYWAADEFGGTGDVSEFVTGDLAASYTEQPIDMGGREVEIRGESIIIEFHASEFRQVGDQFAVTAESCVDESSYELNVDDNGWFAPREDPIYGVEMAFVSTGGTMLLSSLRESEDDEC